MIKRTKSTRSTKEIKNNISKNSKAKKKNKKINFFNLAFFVFILYFALTFINQSQMLSELNSEIVKKEKLVEECTCKKEELKSDVEGIDNKDILLKVVERIARDEYNMVKPNEIIYIERNSVKNKMMFGINNNLNEIKDKNSKEENNDDN